MPDEQYQRIGEVIAEWSRLETILDTLIWHFLKLDMEDGRVVTATLDARPKIRMLRQLTKRHVPSRSMKAQLMSLYEVVEGLQEDRNFMAHGLWGTAMPDNVPAAASIRPRVNPFHVETRSFPTENVKETAALIRDLADHIGEVPDQLAALQKKHDARLRLLKTTQKPIRPDRNP